MTDTEDPVHDIHLPSALMAQLQEHGGLQLFGLLDGTRQDPALLRQFFLLEPDAEYRPLFLGTRFEACLPASPYLIALTDPGSEFMKLEGCHAHNGIIWFLSPCPLEQQWQHWRSLIQAIGTDGNEVLFRFWNGEIFTPYINACNASELSRLLAPVHTLFAPLPHRSWQRFRPAHTTPPALQVGAPEPWWQIQPRHLTAFQPAFDRVLADAIQDQLWRDLPSVIAGIYPGMISAQIQAGMRQARALDLRADSALAAFVHNQLQHGSEFWRSPRFQAAWHAGVQTDALFHQALTINPTGLSQTDPISA